MSQTTPVAEDIYPGSYHQPGLQARSISTRRPSGATHLGYRLPCWVIHLTLFSLTLLSSAGDFLVGSGIQDISPAMGVPLDGAISQNGGVETIHDPLHVRALVFSVGETKVALATIDSTMVSSDIIDAAKTIIEKQTGIPGSHAILAATHTHSTPRAVTGLIDDPAFAAYVKSLPANIAEAVRIAEADLQPSMIGWGSVDVPAHVHNRRWFVEESAGRANPFGDTGETVSMNPGREGLIKPAGPVDPEFYLLSVNSHDGKPRAVMGNYGLHYVGGIPRGHVSADYFGVFSDRVGMKLGVDERFLGILANGTSGDVNAIDFSKPREKYEPFENMQRIADDLASHAVPLLRRLDYQWSGNVDATETVLSLRVRKPDSERLAWANEIAAPKNSPLRLTRPQVYARETLGLAEYPDTVDVRIQAIRIGNLGIVGIPCEVFAETGLAIKAANVFPDTMIMELANGYHGYLPTAEQHGWGGYETWAARSSYLEVDAETKIREASIKLLQKLAK